MTDDDGLHSIDSVRADNLGTCHDHKLTAVSRPGFEEAPPKTPRYPGVGRTQDDEHAPAAPQSADSGSAPGTGVAGDDEIDAPDH